MVEQNDGRSDDKLPREQKKNKSNLLSFSLNMLLVTTRGLELQVPPPLLPVLHDGQLCSKIMIMSMSDAKSSK
jgi:hypothetical protein